MSDKLLMNNYLLILKSTVEVYVHGTLESSNKTTRRVLKSHLFEILNSQARCYDEMVKNGWYSINNVNSSQINSTIKKIVNK